ADGTNTAVDRSDGKNSDMSYATHVLSATPANLQTTLTTTLANLVDSNDHFLFWSFDHGGGTHLESSYSGYDKDAATITDEEELNGWGGNISDSDLANWLNQVPAGHSTVVFAQCFSGGMLDNLIPMTTHAFGMAATNHYEFSWDKDFADAFEEALAKGYRNTYDVYKYAHAHDASAATLGTYTANAGTYQWGIEHPWATSKTTNFLIFAPLGNSVPSVVTMKPLKTTWLVEDLIISHEMLSAAADQNDPNGDALGFRIESVDVGTLTKDGQPVVPGETTLRYGESLVWHAPPEADGTLDAFTVRAFDGAAISTERVDVPIRIGDTPGGLAAVDDDLNVGEDAVDVPLDLTANDRFQDWVTVTAVGQPEHGSLWLVENEVRYTADPDFTGQDTFTYFITDASGETDLATATITVDPSNDPPVAYPDAISVFQDSVDNVIDVVANDFDAEGDPLLGRRIGPISHGALSDPVASVRVSPWFGTLQQNPEGSFIYTPQPGFHGTDTFTYVVNDGQADSNEVTVEIIVRTAPDLFVSYFASPAVAAPGEIISDELQWGLSNLGTADSGPFRTGFYLSTDAIITPADTLLINGTQTIDNIEAGTSPLPPWIGSQAAIPESIAPGNYYIGVLMDDQDAVVEQVETNNYRSRPITIELKPDLTVASLSAADWSYAGQIIGSALQASIENIASVPAVGTFHAGWYLSPDPQITAADIKLLGNGVSVNGLTPGYVKSLDFDPGLRIPPDTPVGNYYIGLLVDETNAVAEKSESNNFSSTPITIRGADLVVDLFTCDLEFAGPNQSLADAVDVTVRNAGWSDAGSFTIGIYLSLDPVITTADTLLSGGTYNVASLPAGYSVNVPLPSLAIPSNVTDGQQFIGVLVDTQHAVAEDDETNNDATHRITITHNTWTVMAFLDGDGNRELQALRNLDQMEQVQMPAGVNVVAMVDRNPD
ncbi:MAG TPA: Ig-like domain-containing protein, partial [Thermoguttaceae bacterium]|nr:Ig-like domain-containing protein [Thermoguttaceae bacterium]